MSDVDLMVREKHDVPDDENTREWCERNGLDYGDELLKAFSEKKKEEKSHGLCGL